MVSVLENVQGVDCHITPENFFLGRFLRSGVRKEFKKSGNMSIDANVSKFVDYMYSGNFFGEYWNRLADGSLRVDKDNMLNKLLASDRSDKAIYETLLQIHVDIKNNTILGDKSGPHLYHVQTLVRWFPQAKVIHVFRDPRAILASEHKKLLEQRQRRIKRLKETKRNIQAIYFELTKPLFSMIIVLYITVAWLYAARLHYKYQRLYPQNYYLSKFEDLVSEPEQSVRKLCEFLDIDFHGAMLNPPMRGSSYERKVETGFDEKTLTRWQTYLKPWMKLPLLIWGKKYLRAFEYVR